MSQQLNDTEVDEFKDILERYSIDNHKEDLVQILLSDNTDDHFPIVVDAPTLFESNIPVFDVLIHSPVQLLPLFDDALVKAQKTIHKIHPERSYMTVKEKMHVRISALPDFPELQRISLPKNADIGNFLSVTGTVIRTTVIKMLEYEKDFICSKCKHIFQVQAAIEQYYSLSKPKKCPKQDCNSVNVLPVGEQGAIPGRCKDYQEIKIQEQVQRLSMGTIPRSMWIVVEDDLVDTCKAGDDITICGIVMRRWRPSNPDIRCDIELFIKANHIQVTNEKRSTLLVTKEMREEFYSFWEKHKDQPLTGRNHILMSLCPQVYGLYVVKLAVILVLTGGVQRQDMTGTQVRGEIHLLLVGDPGTGKSQFLKYATKVMPRAVLTTGIGSTSAGLTVTAVRIMYILESNYVLCIRPADIRPNIQWMFGTDGGEWMLEAGALVLADGGICCIDEFNSIREADKASIHEAMEQQTISVAKAGMVCKLNTRTTILAATNPKGQYDPDQSICVNVALASPLLSRFDLVMVLLDKQNEEWDKVISSYILQCKTPGGDTETSEKDLWSMDKMQVYLSMIKTINPELSEDASAVLQAYYRAQRCADTRNAARTTMRLLQSMIRLSQAHARLMLREVVTIQDAIVAITLMESTMQGAALLGGVNALHTAFPDDPEQEYQIQAEMVLKLLQLEHLLQDETTPSQLNSQHDPGSYLSQTSSVPLVPHSPPASNSTEQKQETSSRLNADLHRDEPETSFDLFNNPLDVSDDKTNEKAIFTPDMQENSSKQNSGDSKNLETEEAQNDVLSNPHGSGLKKTIENRLNLSSSHFNPGASSGTGGLLGSVDNLNGEGVKERLLAGLDEEDKKAKLTFTTKNKGKQRKKCASKLKGMMQESRATTSTNTTEHEEQKRKTAVVSTIENGETNSLSGKVRQLYSNYERRKNKQTEKTSCENSFDESINDPNINSENRHEISRNESELFDRVQPDETKKALDERREKSSLSRRTVSKLMKFAFDDSRTSNLSTSSSSAPESGENLNKSDISNTAHPPAALTPNPSSLSAEPILSSLDSTIFPKSNETVNFFTTDFLSGHKWHALPVNTGNSSSQVQDGGDSVGVDSVQMTPSTTVNDAAKIFTVLKHKEQNEGPPRVIQDGDLNTSPISSNSGFNFTLPSQVDFPTTSIHVSTPIAAAHKTAASANVTKRTSSMFEIDDDDLDLDDDFDFEVGFLQSDPKRTRLK